MPLSQTERIAQGLFRHYLPHDKVIYGLRPEWLVNPETGNALELDIYFPDLKLAIEVQGQQHNHFTPGLQETRDDFAKQVRHDGLKVRICAEAGIDLRPLTIHQLCRPYFEPMMRQLMYTHGRQDQFNRIAPPYPLYAQAERLSHRPVVRKPYRKPGLGPLLQRTWRRLLSLPA